MTEVHKSRAASIDLDNVWSYIAADTFIRRILARCQSYSHQPHLGESRSELGREVRCFSVIACDGEKPVSRSDVNIRLSEIVCHFEQLEDPRSTINRHHPLPSVLTISLMGVLAGADGPTGISRWAVAKKDLLVQALDLPYGLPSRCVIRRVLSALKVDAFQSCFACWLNSLRDAAKEKAGINAEEKDHMAIDGKTMRHSHNRAKGLGPMHMVSAWLSEFGLTLAQVATVEKSNEITAIPELLKLIDLKGSVITIDAMGTQVAIAEQIVDGEGDYILALKANQNTLFQQVLNCVEDHITDDFARLKTARLEEPSKKSHGRVDSRMYLQFEVPNAFSGTSRWKGLKTIGMSSIRA